MKDIVIAILLFALAIVVVVSLVGWLTSIRCGNVASAMQMRHSWGFTTGCRIEQQPGKWIPLANYRAI